MKWYDVVESLFVIVLVVGVAFIYWPSALILLGVLGIVACERRSAIDASRSQANKNGSERNV